MAQGQEDDSAVTILQFCPDENIRYKLNEAALEAILGSPDIAGMPLSIVSVAGVPRTGKSFLMNFMVSYLEWLESGSDEPWNFHETRLDRFRWCSGTNRVTVGIQLWSRPFIISDNQGRKVAVLLMDTQGTFDDKTTHAESVAIFALSTHICSLQIYNIFRQVEESHLQHLLLFGEYGRIVAESGDGKPFQKLMFLIRDWPLPQEYEFGISGGTKFIEDKLKARPDHQMEHIDLRRSIREIFEEISGFTMSEPGRVVIRHKGGSVNLSDVDPDFKENITEFLETTLDPENLAEKKINGQCLNGNILLEMIKNWVTLFQRDNNPSMENIYQATKKANDQAAFLDGLRVFTDNMQTLLRGHREWSDLQALDNMFHDARKIAIEHFLAAPGLGNKESRHELLPEFRVKVAHMFETGKMAAYGRYYEEQARREELLRRQQENRQEIMDAIVKAAVPILAATAIFAIKRMTGEM